MQLKSLVWTLDPCRCRIKSSVCIKAAPVLKWGALRDAFIPISLSGDICLINTLDWILLPLLFTLFLCPSAALGGRRAPFPQDVQTLPWHRTGCTGWKSWHRVPLWVSTFCSVQPVASDRWSQHVAEFTGGFCAQVANAILTKAS